MKINTNRIVFHFGNALMLASLIGTAYIFFPLIPVYFSPPQVIQNVSAKEGTFITIPKIGAQSKVVEQVDPWNEAVYNEALKDGVAHAKGTSLPGEKGTTFLFAHSSSTPWNLTRMNTIFLRLGELNTGDEIEIAKDGKVLRYKVANKKEVDPTEVNYLLQTEKDQLILQTCTPIGTSLKRLLIFAVLT